jgi:hypothetical protein
MTRAGAQKATESDIALNPPNPALRRLCCIGEPGSAICLSHVPESSGEAEEPVHKARFSRRSGFKHEALPLSANTRSAA